MPKEFQRIMDRLTEKLPNNYCYVEEILIATAGSAKEHCKLFTDVQKILYNEGLATNWEKKKLTHDRECLGFEFDPKGTALLVHKSDAIRNWKEP